MEGNLIEARKSEVNMILSVVGLPGTGKSTVVDVMSQTLPDGRGAVVYFGRLVVDEVAKRKLPPGEESEHLVRTELRRRSGMAAMAVLSIPQIKDLMSAGQHVLVDGLYSQSELDYLRAKFKDEVRVLAVHADRIQRVKRLASREHRPLTEQEMDDRDRREIDSLEKAPPIVTADYHILNNGSQAQLGEAVKRVATVAFQDLDME